MEKLTLTRKEAAAILGISTATVTQWVLNGRLKAYRVNNRPKSPYLFTREDCLNALQAVPAVTVELKRLNEREGMKTESLLRRQKETSNELDELLKIRTRGKRIE
ncbi:helix-turn-helix domain-containing protein [Citrobacter freundii]|uniref:helix-turn-helix domain-containing protein n=1 Tax=Citrobacter freundii TaxID=546 RepID=UPI001FFDEEB4|nr:helix-turn-helix domain-containing protein [Citrobacter freundii]